MLNEDAPSGFQYFPCKFSHEMALVSCLCAFRPPRLAQNVRLTFWGAAFFP